MDGGEKMENTNFIKRSYLEEHFTRLQQHWWGCKVNDNLPIFYQQRKTLTEDILIAMLTN